ncbi:hypothetical protein [Rhodanobacter sp. DHG33]|uniref:hypothetical protein n=1 Tax=Rhodanobacter sp. DHG33 TaxID=2775921 RepID=UPI00177FDE98|nr:hypothetical protein [Rhodanobacter sp. DHG33]MBD8898913.1 hypothetical protein [Rhodanobacter sp. DHG33]
MSARHWMIGCLIGLAGMGSAMAADAGIRDIAATGRSTTDTGTHDTASNSGSDALGLNRDCPSPRHGSDAENGDADNHGGGGTAGGGGHEGRISAPVAAKPATLGWQSLLPGSIQ